MSDAAGSVAGFCGKLPIRSDFVTRRVPLAFVEPWHDWLAEALAGMRDALGEDWLDAYLYGPIWRFALPAGSVGSAAMIGTLTPSVDAVGRYFPLTIVLPAVSPGALAAAVTSGDAWFEEAEALSLAALDGELDVEALSERVMALPRLSSAGSSASLADVAALPVPGLLIPCDGETETIASALAAHAPRGLTAGHSLWWTEGCERIGGSVLLARGLPGRDAFSAMFTGAWNEGGWRAELPPSVAWTTEDERDGGS